MRTRSRNADRSAILIVLLLLSLLVALLQVPNLWWRELARSPSEFWRDRCREWYDSRVQRSPPVAAISRYEPRCELRGDTPLVAADSTVISKRKKPLGWGSRVPVERPSQRSSERQGSPFRFTSWPAQRKSANDPPAIELRLEVERTLKVAKKKPTIGDSHRPKAPLSRPTDVSTSPDIDDTETERDALIDLTEPPRPHRPHQVHPLDLPNLDLAFPNEVQNANLDDHNSETARPWGPISTLTDQLNELRLHGNRDVAVWTERCLFKLDELQSVESVTDENSSAILDNLLELTQSPTAREPHTGSLGDDARVRRVAYALRRRSEVWRALLEAEQSDVRYPRPVESVSRISTAINSVSEALATLGPDHAEWRNYLRLDQLREVATSALGDAGAQRDVARDVLHRMTAVRLTDGQRRFLADPRFAELQAALQVWAIEPFESGRFLQSLESYEADPGPHTAERLVDQSLNLSWHESKSHRELAGVVDLHYRNANVRLAVTGTLLNQLLPVLRPMQESVSENVLGAEVSGQNQTWTQLAVELVPDNERVNIQLNATGTTQSKTVSTKGPVRLFSQGRSWFRAGKPILLHKLGIATSSAQVDANGGSELVDVETDYDRVPILGWLVRQFAIDQHQEHRVLLRRHVKDKVSDAARNRINEVVQERISNTRSLMREKVLVPLREVDLAFEPIEMKTDRERVTMRARLAGRHQLAAHTARPRALRGSVFSMQLHQSAINNVLQQLDLSGQRIELEELIGRLQSRLGIARQDIHDDIPEGVQIRLADSSPLSVEFDNDRVVVAIRISELITRRRAYRNFVVRAKYTADVEDLNLNLTREGGIELISEKIGFRDQFALRGIFTKVMANDHRLQILRGRFEEDPRMASLNVTQFVSRDGWIGISVGEPIVDVRTAATPQSTTLESR